MTKAFEPYSSTAALSKAKSNYFKAQPVSVYMQWRQKMDCISQKVTAAHAVCHTHSGAIPALLGNAFLSQDRKTQDKFLKVLKRAFQHLGHSDQVDDRNRQAYAFMRDVTRKDYSPATDYNSGVAELQSKNLHLSKKLDASGEKEQVILNLYSIISNNEYAVQELAEAWVGEFLHLHRLHQQILITHIQEFFYLLHSACTENESQSIHWALNASRSKTAQPYLLGAPSCL